MKELAKAETKLPKKNAKSYLKLPYARILVPAEEGGFTAEILEFPGCYAEGETPNEAFENLEGAAESWIEATLEQGQEIPPPSANENYSGRFALRLPRDLHRQAAQKANRDGVSLNQCFVTAIASWVGADNLLERIAHKVVMNLVQANVYSVTISGAALYQGPSPNYWSGMVIGGANNPLAGASGGVVVGTTTSTGTVMGDVNNPLAGASGGVIVGTTTSMGTVMGGPLSGTGIGATISSYPSAHEDQPQGKMGQWQK